MIAGLVDNRNASLLKELQKNYSIKVELITDAKKYECYSIDNISTIYVPESNICIDSFTHELLHIYIRSKGIFIGARLKRKIQASELLAKLYSETLLDHIGNCLDHIKMLPIYLELGFDREKFIRDYEKKKCTKQDVEIIELYWKQGDIYSASITDFYLGKYFGAKACPNANFDYKNLLKALYLKDKVFFTINEKLVQRWSNMKIDIHDKLEDDYKSIVDDYINQIEGWVSSNTIR